MSGGGGSTHQPAHTSQVNVPPELIPFLYNNASEAAQLAHRPYEAYMGERVAGYDPMRMYAYQNAWGANQNTNALMGEGYNALNSGSDMARAFATGQGPQVSGPGWYQMDQPEMLNAQNAGAYMNPYMQNVVDIQKAKATEDYQKQNLARNADMVSKGAFGGTRQAVIQGEADKAYSGQLGNIQQQGQEAAYRDAVSAFNADRAARMGADTTNLQAMLQQTGQMQAAQQANQGAALAGLQQYMQGVGQYGQMAGQWQGLNQDYANFLEQMGRNPQQYEQTMRDIAYGDWQNQQNYAQQQATWLSQLLHGTGQTNVSEQPQVNPYAQLFGAGLAGLGAYNAYNSGGGSSGGTGGGGGG